MYKFLEPEDQVVTVYAEPASGPGWSNTPLWVVVRNRMEGRLRMECVQPEFQTDVMHTLYPISAVVQRQLVREVELLAREPEQRRKPLIKETV
jgi:hypothetical protein